MSVWADEEWRSIPGFSRYDVSNLGRVRSWRDYHGGVLEEARILKPSNEYYRRVGLAREGKYVSKSVHLLVLVAFVGERPFTGAHARHLNGDSHDNRLANLKWGTSQENYADKVEHGTAVRGERAHKAILTEQSVRQMRRMYRTGDYTAEQLGALFGVAKPTAHQAITGATWKHVEDL